MNFDHNFNYNSTYYRVVNVEQRSGYYYNDGEMEGIESGKGILTSPHPKYEFDSLDRVGSWLFLGRAVRKLRIPQDAKVVINKPLSQGGCYTWSSDRVELLEVISFAELMALINTEEVKASFINLQDYEFPKSFQFPKDMISISLNSCVLNDGIIYPEKLTDFHLSNCSFESVKNGLPLPNSVEERLVLNDQKLAHVMLPIKENGDVSLNDCILDSVEFPKSLKRLSIWNCVFSENFIFPHVEEHLTLSNSGLTNKNFSVGENGSISIMNCVLDTIFFPKKTKSFFTYKCEFNNCKLPEENVKAIS